jgi:FAD/FMN-containing dehydrogenase
VRGAAGPAWRPRDRAALVALMSARPAEAAPLWLFGRDTKRRYGSGTQDGVQPLSLAGLDRVVRYRPEDLTVTVEAGIRLGDLETLLGERGQRLGWQVPGGEDASVGGALAAGIDGPLQSGLGRMRDDLLEVVAVLAGGTVVRGGAPVVKSVAGYDLPRWWVGSMGVLGAVVEVTLRLRPRPRDRAAVSCPFADAAEAAAWVDRARGLGQVRGLVLEADGGGGLAGLALIEGRSGAVSEAVAALRPAEATDPDAATARLAASLAPGPGPWLHLGGGPAAIAHELAAASRALPGVALAADALRGGFRFSWSPGRPLPAELAVAVAGRPWRWEGAAPALAGAACTGMDRIALEAARRVARAFDPNRALADRLGLYAAPAATPA